MPTSYGLTRRNRFFKPAGGHGSKTAYRGEKLTRRVWGDNLVEDNVAQARTLPNQRVVVLDHKQSAFKLDVRLYTYGGVTLLVSARVYQSQTTNMWTPGGSFAHVLVVVGRKTRPCLRQVF